MGQSHRQVLRAALLAIAVTPLFTISYAAQVLRSSSVFEEANQGSRQLTILKVGESARVTGDSVERDDQVWLPVLVDGKSGWIDSNRLKLTEGDVGYVPPVPANLEAAPRRPRSRLWLGVGPMVMGTESITVASSTFSGEFYGGAAIGLGFEARFGRPARWLLGIRGVIPWTNERTQGFGAGRVSRVSVLPGFGYTLIPDQLELMAHAGLGFVQGESPDFAKKIAFLPGVTLSWQLSSAEAGSVYQGIELGAFRMEETQGAADLGLTTGLCNAVGAIFGDTTSDPTCVQGNAPAAYIVTVLYRIGLNR